MDNPLQDLIDNYKQSLNKINEAIEEKTAILKSGGISYNTRLKCRQMIKYYRGIRCELEDTIRKLENYYED